MRTEELRGLSRDQLVDRAASLGIPRPKTLTQAELVDEIVRRTVPAPRQRRGWLGRARDLVATVVERGLHLPEAASLLRSTQARRAPAPPPPLPTVTLAEIYAAQGYHAKAVTVLDEVLRREPDHAEARTLRDRFGAELSESERADLQDREEAQREIVTRTADSRGDIAKEGNAMTEIEEGDALAEQEQPSSPALDGDALSDGEAGSDVVAMEPGRPGYDVDDVVALATDAETAFAYWEVRPLSFARLQKRHPNGRMVVRVLATRPNERGAVSTSIRDVPVDELVGDVFLRGLPPGGEVRIAVGWKIAGEIVPLAVAPDLKMPFRFGTERPGLHTAPQAAPPEPAPRPRVEAPYRRLLERAAPLTWVDLGGDDRAEATRHTIIEREEILRIERWFGGASDLHGVVDEERRRILAMRGGASDLHGGASDLSLGRSRSDLIAVV
jgi:hypothetical protein